jgi:hypothetical protein
MAKITMALAAAAIALASPVLAVGNRDNSSTSKVSQYCVPQDDIPGAQTLYC